MHPEQIQKCYYLGRTSRVNAIRPERMDCWAMILSLPQVCWSALAAIALQFLVLQWRLKDAGQGDFALSVSILAAASAAETWSPVWSRLWGRSATEIGFLW